MSAQPLAFERAMNAAVILDAPQTATMLLRPFRVEMLTPGHAGALLALAGHYGPEWMSGMLAVWFGERSRAYHDAELRRPEWLASLLEATAAARETGLRDEVLGSLREHGEESQALLVSVLRSATALSPADRSASGLDTLANCASRSASSSATAHAARANGHSQGRAASTSSTRSAWRRCPSGLRPCVRAARTPWS